MRIKNKLEHLKPLKEAIQSFIDWLYGRIPFSSLIPKETFRYAVCGGSNTVLDVFLYFITYNFILQKKILHLKILSISPYIASFMMVFPITFFTGFLLSKYITFSYSNIGGRIQLFRYGVTVLVCILLNYVLLKLFVEHVGLYPTLSKIITTCVVVIYSYFSQKHFTFKTAKKTVY
jgi:putative flippase GtrA